MMTEKELIKRYSLARKGIGYYALLKDMHTSWEEIYPLVKDRWILGYRVLFNIDEFGKIAAIKLVDIS